MPKPPADLSMIPKADKERLSCPQSPTIKQDAHTLDETSKQNLQKRVQKLVEAAQSSFAKGALALQQDRIRFLAIINNGAKVDDQPSRWY
ncbi:MAG: hypothetical protein MMC33_010725 [Icmadophila ericetorum]|nr:hypothetical protein [Icmadophila ericetorum]